MSMLAELTAWLETRLADLHSVTVARVVSFDPEGPRANVQPLLKRTYVKEDGTRTVVSLPQIERCPVVYPRGGGWSTTWPLAAGDLVLLLFAERSLDRWLSSQDGAEVSPDDPRKHDLSDAIVVAGIAPWSMAAPVHAEDFVITREGEATDRAQIRLRPNGEVVLGEGATLSAARETDPVEITPATAPAFYDALAAISAALTVPIVPPYTGPIGGTISARSAGRVKAT